jgi:hypothetical protein
MVQDIIDVGGHVVGQTEDATPEKLIELGKKMLCSECAKDPANFQPTQANKALFVHRLNQIFPTMSSFNLRFEFAPISAYVEANNFSADDGLKWYLNALISHGVATQGDYDKIAAILKEQGIVM